MWGWCATEPRDAALLTLSRRVGNAFNGVREALGSKFVTPAVNHVGFNPEWKYPDVVIFRFEANSRSTATPAPPRPGCILFGTNWAGVEGK